MMPARALTIAPVLTLLLTACRPNQPAPAGRPAAADVPDVERPAVATPQDTGAFLGTTGAIHRARPGARTAILHTVQVTGLPDYDRVVFEFAGDTAPGYHVEYATHVVRCGSGDPVSVAGAARLVVRFEPAQAHDDQGRATVVRREWVPALSGVKEMKLICDFEGQVEWVLGVAAALGVAAPSLAPYRVVEATRPGVVTVDVRHGP